MARKQRQQRRQRRLNAERRSFTNPLTGKQARKIAGSQARTEFNPVIRQKKSEIRGSARRTHELGQAYNNLAAQNAQAQSIALQAYEAGQAAATARINGAAQADNAALQQIAAQDQQTSQMLGGPANTQGIQTMAQGNEALQAQRNTLAQPLTVSGANNVAYLGSRVNTARLAGFKAKDRQRGETRKLKQDKSALLRERGQSKVANIQKLREQEQNQRTARQAFNLERQGQNFDQRMARNDNRRANEAQRNANQEQRNQNRQARQEAREAKVGGGKAKLTPSERRDIREGRHNALSAGNAFIRANGVPKNKKEWTGLQVILEEKSEITPSEAAFAVKRLRQKHHSRQSAGGTGTKQGTIHR